MDLPWSCDCGEVTEAGELDCGVYIGGYGRCIVAVAAIESGFSDSALSMPRAYVTSPGGFSLPVG